eukprot:s1474_g16.t1
MLEAFYSKMSAMGLGRLPCPQSGCLTLSVSESVHTGALQSQQLTSHADRHSNHSKGSKGPNCMKCGCFCRRKVRLTTKPSCVGVVIFAPSGPSFLATKSPCVVSFGSEVDLRVPLIVVHGAMARSPESTEATSSRIVVFLVQQTPHVLMVVFARYVPLALGIRSLVPDWPRTTHQL